MRSIDATSQVLAGCTVWCAAAMAHALVVSPADLPEAMAKARPGSVLRIADGHYRDLGTLELEATGQPQQPIIVAPQTPGGVTFSGRMRLVMRGEHWQWRGFDFVNVHHPQAVHVEGRALRITANRFINCGDPNSTSTHLLRVGHTSNEVEIDHNYFLGSLSISIGTIEQVVLDEGVVSDRMKLGRAVAELNRLLPIG